MRSPDAGQKTHFDDALPGFGVRVSQGGAKSFVVMFGKRRQLKTLGRYPALSLAEARREAKRVQADVETLALPSAERPSLSFAEARERFLRDSAARNKPRTASDYHRLLHRHFAFERSISDLSRSDIVDALEPLQGTPSEQQHAFVAIRTMMNWCARRGLIETSPVPPLRFAHQSRERVLSDEELRTVWKRAKDTGYPYGSIIQLLILTGQRRGEIAGLRRTWIKDNTFVLPPGFAKNKREHRFPIGPMTQKLIDNLPDTGDLLFPSRHDPDKAYNGWGKAKARFDAPLSIEPYTLHDLRRTYSSVMARIDVPIHVTERLLNHMSGTISGVAAVYNRHTYVDEMRDSVAHYDAFLAKVVARC